MFLKTCIILIFRNFRHVTHFDHSEYVSGHTELFKHEIDSLVIKFLSSLMEFCANCTKTMMTMIIIFVIIIITIIIIVIIIIGVVVVIDSSGRGW